MFSLVCQAFFQKVFLDKISNGEGGIWTLAPLLTTYSLSRRAPSATWVLLQVLTSWIHDERRGWDSNPRALADKRFSRPPRYDHFDTPARERVMGIEPTYPAWKAGVLPLNYTRMKCPVPESNQRHEDFQSSALPTELTRHKIAGVGFEPTTFGLWARRASRLLHPAISYFCTWFLK